MTFATTTTTAITTTPTTTTRPRKGQRQRHQHRRRGRCRRLLVAVAALAAATNLASSSADAAGVGGGGGLDLRYFVAGGTCAAFSHGITTPIDVVKTKIQADPEKFEGEGLVGATLRICRDEGGPGALLTGLGPTVLGYGVEGAMKFGAYEMCKPIFLRFLGKNRRVLAYALSSFLAGAVASVLLVPMESLRIKQVTDPSYKRDTLLTGLPRIIREDGFVTTMGGVWAMLAKQVPYTFGKQVSFDLVAGFLYSVVFVAAVASTSSEPVVAVVRDGVIFSAFSAERWKWIVSVLSAAIASVAACLCSQPGDMVLTETYNNNNHDDGRSSETAERPRGRRRRGVEKKTEEASSGKGKPGDFREVVRTVNDRGGIPEFFRGTRARLIHVGTIITSQLVVYDLVKQFLGLPATGSKS